VAPDTKPFVNPKLTADPYIWPAGCKKKKYTTANKISKNCLIQKYYIGDGQHWGWRRGSKWPYYYRVGNNAVMITDVISGTVLSDKPHVVNVVDDVFVVQDSGDMRHKLR
jgi:hypothetical protein